MAKKEEFLKVDFAKNNILMGIWAFTFEDNGHHVAYVPSLRLSAYGATVEEAYEMLQAEILPDFADGILALKSESAVTQELGKYGWRRGTILRKKFYNTPYVDEKGILKDFHLPEETKITQEYLEPAGA